MDLISPASSDPSIVLLGFLRLNAIRMGSQNKGGILKLRHLQHSAVIIVAYTLISTSLSLGVGFSTSLS